MPVVTPMTPERWQRVKKILEESLAREASARVAYLEGACAGDDDLRRDVESFLAHERPDDFLEHPAIGRPPPVPDSALADLSPIETGHVEEVRPIDLTRIPDCSCRLGARATSSSSWHRSNSGCWSREVGVFLTRPTRVFTVTTQSR